MAKLSSLMALDLMLLDLLEITYLGFVKERENFSYEKQIEQIKYIYFAPTFDGQTKEIHSNYALATVKIRRQNNGTYYTNYRNPQIATASWGSNAQNASEPEKIAYFLCNSCLNSFIKSIDTKERLVFWLLQKDYIYRLASCFLQGKQLLQKDYQKGIFTELEIEVLYKDFELLQNLYQLIDKRWEKIKNEFEQNRKFLFNSSLELFQEIIKVHFDNEYKQFLTPRKSNSVKNNKKEYLFIKKFLSESSTDKHYYKNKKKQFEKTIYSDEYKNYWLKKIKEFCQREASQDKFIDNHIVTTNNLIMLKFQIVYGRNFKKYPDYTMFDGVFHRGTFWKSVNGDIREVRESNKTK